MIFFSPFMQNRLRLCRSICENSQIICIFSLHFQPISVALSVMSSIINNLAFILAHDCQDQLSKACWRLGIPHIFYAGPTPNILGGGPLFFFLVKTTHFLSEPVEIIWSRKVERIYPWVLTGGRSIHVNKAIILRKEIMFYSLGSVSGVIITITDLHHRCNITIHNRKLIHVDTSGLEKGQMLAC